MTFSVRSFPTDIACVLDGESFLLITGVGAEGRLLDRALSGSRDFHPLPATGLKLLQEDPENPGAGIIVCPNTMSNPDKKQYQLLAVLDLVKEFFVFGTLSVFGHLPLLISYLGLIYCHINTWHTNIPF